MALPAGAVHVWFTRTERVSERPLLEQYRLLLDADERARLTRFQFEPHRHTFLVAHALVRTTLSRYAPTAPRRWAFKTNKHGRPAIHPPQLGLRFNLSHTDGLVACAVTRGAEVGVDVEATTRKVDIAVADRFFSQPEVAALRALPKHEQPYRFLQYWTLKESYIKARGMGLALPLGQFAFDMPDKGNPAVRFFDAIDDEPARWQFRLTEPVHGFVLALAMESTGGAPEPTVTETVPLS